MISEKKSLIREIIVIILLVSSTTLMIFTIESLIYFNDNINLNKSGFLSKLYWSLIKSSIINFGLVVLFYINKNRIKKNKSIL